MAGEFERLKWVLELDLDDAALRRGLQAVTAAFNQTLQAARTPGSNQGNATAGANSIAAQAGDIAALRSALERRVTQGVKAGSVSQDFQKEFRAQTRPITESSLLAAFGERPNGRVDQARASAQYYAARDRVNAQQLAAEKASLDALNAQSAADKEAALNTARDAKRAEQIRQNRIDALAAEAPASQQDINDEASKQLKAKQTEGRVFSQLNEDPAYAQATAKAAIERSRLGADTEQILAADKRYSSSTAEFISARQRITAEVQGILAADQQYIDATAAAARGRAKSDAQVQQILASDKEYITSQAEAAGAKHLAAARTKQEILAGAGIGGAAGVAQLEQLNASNSAASRLSKARVSSLEGTLLAQEENRKVLIQERVIQNELNRALKVGVAAAEKEAFERKVASGQADPGSTFQRIQAAIASRQSGSFRDPNEYQNFGQFLTSKFITTAGFAASGALTYGAIQGLRAIITEGEKLEQQFAQIKAQFKSLGDADNFSGFRQGILGIARDSGVAATEVAAIGLQFKGAFGRTQNDTQILDQVQGAVEISKVTGLSLKEITDSLTAAALSYGVSVRDIGDATLAVQEQTGVLAKETITAIADIAPVANQAGLSLQEVAAIAGVAQQRSGRSGSSIAESFGRVLPAIQKNSADIISFFERVDPSRVKAVITALATGQSGTVFKTIGEDFHKFSEAQQNFVIELLGGRREAQNIIPVLQGYGDVLANVAAEQNASGKTADYYGRLQETLTQQLSRLATTAKSLGEAILRSGVSAALQEILKSFTNLLSITGGVLTFFADLNSTLGGVPAKIIGITLAVVAMTKAVKALSELSILQGIGSFLTGGAAAAEGGLLSRLGGGLGASSAGGGLLRRIGLRRGVTTTEGIAAGTNVGEALGIDALGGTIAAGTATTTASGAGIGALGATGVGLIAVAGVVALNRYQDFRKKASKKASEKLAELQKLDLPELERMKQQESTPGSESIGRYFSGEKTDYELIIDAIQLKKGANLQTELDALVKSFEGKSKAQKYLRKILDDLKKHGTDDAKFAKAQSTFDTFNTLADHSPAEVDVTQFIAKDLGSSVGLGDPQAITEAVRVDLENEVKQGERLVEIDKLLKTTQGKRRDDLLAEAANIRKTFFSGDSGSSAPDLLSAARGILTEFNTKGTTLGFKITDFPNINDFVDHLGTNIREHLADVRGAKTVDDAMSKVSDALISLKANDALFKEGKIGAKQHLDLLGIARKKAKEALDLSESLGQEESILQPLRDALDAIEGAAFPAAKALSDSRILSKTRAATFAGAPPGLAEGLHANAILAELRNNKELGPQEREQYFTDYVNARNAQLQDLAKNAKNLEERQKILDTPIVLPPELQSIANEDAIRGGGDKVDATFQQLQAATSEGYDNLVKQVADAMAAGKSAIDAVKQILTSRLRAIIHSIVFIRAGASTKEIEALNASYKAARDAADKIFADDGGATSGLDSLGTTKTIKQPPPNPDDQRDLLRRTLLANSHLEVANSGGDPIAAAQGQLRAAQIGLNFAKDPAEAQDFRASIAEANTAINDAVAARSQAYLAIFSALADGDPIKEAQVQIAIADSQLQAAHSEAARANALAAKISAQHQLRDAINAAADAQSQVVIALITASGDTVKAAQASLALAQEDYNRFLAQGGDAKSVKGRDLFRSVVTSADSLRRTQFAKDEDDIQFDLDMKKISTAQAISRLQNLASQAGTTEDERRQILRQIESLKQQAAHDLQFNLPDIVLPTFYEARRLKQQGPGGFQSSFIGQGQNYTDNRQINVVVTAQTNASPKDIANAVAAEMNKPSTFGTSRGLY